MEGFPTLLAFIVFLQSVNPDMLSESRNKERFSHITYIHRASLQGEFSGVHDKCNTAGMPDTGVVFVHSEI